MLKRLSWVGIFVLLSIFTFSQTLPKPFPRSSPFQPVTDARVNVTLNFSIPKVVDTAHGLNGGQDSLGLFIQILSTGDVYHRDTTAGGHKWSLVGTGGSGSSIFLNSRDTITCTACPFTVGKVVYKTSTAWDVADTVIASTFPIAAMVSKVFDANTFEITYGGQMSWPSNGLVAGNAQYLTLNGNITDVPPSSVQIPIGFALDNDHFVVQILSGFSNNGSGIPLGTLTPYHDVEYGNSLLQTKPILWHKPVRLATAAALPANTYSNGTAGVGATITANANGALTIDGVSVAVSDRILVKDEATQTKNGLYTVTQAGDGSHPFILTRGNYSNTSDNLDAGASVFVQLGTANASTNWQQTTAGGITFGSSNIVFVKLAGSGGGGGSPNTNSGSGFRWANGGNNILKSYFGSTYITIDSSSNSGALTAKLDTTHIHTDLYNDNRYSFQGKFYQVLYNKNSWANLSDFVDSSCGCSVSGSKIVFSSGAGNYSKFLGIAAPNATQHWIITAKFILGTKNSSNMGMGVGHASNNTFVALNELARTNSTTGGGGDGFLKIDYTTAGAATNLVSKTGLVTSTGDAIILTLERNVNTYITTLRNVTTNATEIDTSVTLPQTFNLTTPPVVNNTGRFSVYNFGGNSFTLDSLSVVSYEVSYANLMLVGDSRMVGYGAPNNQTVYFDIGQYVPNTIVNSGGGDRLTEVLSRINEIIALHPKVVFLGPFGANDFGSGQSLGTVEANYASVISQLQAAGITVYVGTFYFAGANPLALDAYLKSNYPTIYIDTWDATNCPGCLQTDNVHLTAAGQLKAANAILQSFLIKDNNNLLSYSPATSSSTPSGSFINNGTSLQSSANFNIDGTGGLNILNVQSTGSFPGASIANLNTSLSNYSQLTFQPSVGSPSNTAMAFNVMPFGTGQTGDKAHLTIWATNFYSDGTNFHYGELLMNGTSMDILTGKNGSSALDSIRFITGSNAAQIVLAPNNTTFINGTTTTITGAVVVPSTIAVGNNGTFNSDIILPASSGTNRGVLLRNVNSANDNLGYLVAYPSSGSAVTPAFAVSPKGTGILSNLKAELNVYNTDVIADGTNFEFLSIRSVGSGGYGLYSGHGGTGSDRNVEVASGTATNGTTNLHQFVAKTNGGLQFGLYGSGTYTGTVAKYLAVDASGNVIEDAGTGASSGNYTPTLSNTTNITGSTLTRAYYQKIGNIVSVTVCGFFSISAANTESTLTIDLPFTTATTNQVGVGNGELVCTNASPPGTRVVCDASVNAAGTFQIYMAPPASTTAIAFTVTIKYQTN